MDATLTARAPGSQRRATSSFYVVMAAVLAAVAFLGFAPTYWVPMIRGTLAVPPVVHIHAAAFFVWTLLLLVQAWLPKTGRLARHRALGMVGISLATAMTILGVLVAIRQMQAAEAIGQRAAGETFAIVPLVSIAFFAVTFALAAANVSRPEWHKRLIILATASILEAPIARWFIVFLAPDGPPGPLPVAVTLMPAFTAYALVLVAIGHDWRSRGRPHPAYVVGGATLVALKLLQEPISTSEAWHAVAAWFLALAR